jgi:hypothetical protein
MLYDHNKAITAISYNHLNLPEKITLQKKWGTQYIYDAYLKSRN